MKTFYSILYALISPETGEKISLGILLSDGEKAIFRQSKWKLSIVHSMVSAEQGRFITAYLNSLNRNTFSGRPMKTELEFNDAGLSLLNEKYIEYLSVYNQNVISFSKPNIIDVEVSDSSINKLFTKLINEKPKSTIENHRLQKIKEQFISRAIPYYHIDRLIKPEEFPKLIMPVTIDFIGKNERPVFAQLFDFERPLSPIKNDFFDLQQLQDVIAGQGFVVSWEPDIEKFATQHQAWNALRSMKDLEYIDESEIDKLEEYAVQHGVKPW